MSSSERRQLSLMKDATNVLKIIFSFRSNNTNFGHFITETNFVTVLEK